VSFHGPVRFFHEPGVQNGATQASDPEKHLAQFFSWRQDRRAGPERFGQVHHPENHGRLDKEIEGEAIPMPGIKIGYLPQEPQLDPDQTVRHAVEEGIGGSLAAKARLEEVYAAYGDENADFDALAAEQAELEAIIAASGSENTDLQLELAADALNLPPWDATIRNLSGGEKRRVALCRLLLSKPDMLLLDEPTNHLDAESVNWLEQFLQRFPGTVVAITHDRYFLDNAAEWILELDRGQGIPYKGNYSDWLDQKERRWSPSKRAKTPACAR
jgi:sulfate-transporting ATPase